MYNKLLLLAICIVFGINIQTVSAQTNEKWLPSSMMMYNTQDNDTICVNIEYDTANRLTSFIVGIASEKMVMGCTLKYESGIYPIKLIRYMSNNDSIISEAEFTINYKEHNIIEFVNDSDNISVLHLDKDGKFLTKVEETITDSIKTKYVTTTFEYKNNILYKRTENTLEQTHPIISIEGEEVPSESKVESVMHTHNTEPNKRSVFQNYDPRWLSIYLRIEEVFSLPDFLMNIDGEDNLLSEVDITHHYNEDGFSTGWDAIDSENNDETHCTIEYVKAK